MHPLLEKFKQIIEQKLTRNKLTMESESETRLRVRNDYPGGQFSFYATVIPINAIMLLTPVSGSLGEVSDEKYKCIREFFDEISKDSGMWIVFDKDTGRFGAAVKIHGLLNSIFSRTDLADEIDDAIEEFHEFFRRNNSKIKRFLGDNSLPLQ